MKLPKKLKKTTQNYSITTICFTLFLGFVSAMLAVFFSHSFNRFIGEIESQYEAINEQSEKDMIMLITLYDEIIYFLTHQAIHPKKYKILEALKASAKLEKKHHLQALLKIKKKYQVDSSFSDNKDWVIYASTSPINLNVDLLEWPYLNTLLTNLVPGKATSQVIWSARQNQLRKYTYLSLPESNIGAQFETLINQFRGTKQVIEYMDNIASNNPYLDKVVLFDTKGFNIIKDRSMPNKKAIKYIQQLSPEDRIIDTKIANGKERFINVDYNRATIHPRSLKLAQFTYNDRAEKEIKALTRDFLFDVFLLFLIAVFLTWVLAKLITKPLLKVISEIKIIAPDHIGRQIKQTGYGEIKQLISTVNKLSLDLKASNTSLQHFARKTINLQETERRHIASDLHDSVGQLIIAAKIQLETSKHPDTRCLELLSQASEELRHIYTAIHPSILNDLGLEATFNWYADFLLEGIEHEINFESVPVLAIEKSTHLFRIFQECLANILKHSQASKCKISMIYHKSNSSLHMEIHDNGTGLSATSEAGFGSKSMGLRLGELSGTKETFKSSLGGLGIHISIPVA